MTDERTLIKASMIIAYSSTHQQHVLLRDGVVVFEGDTIIHVGKSYSEPVDINIDGHDKLVAPGFVNGHAELKWGMITRSYMEDYANINHALYNELLYEIWPKVFQCSKAEAKTIAEFSLLDLLRSGCTTIVENMSAYRVGPDELINLLKSLGIRAYLGGGATSGRWNIRPNGTQVTFDWNDEEGFEALQRDIEFVKQYNGIIEGQIHAMLGAGAVDRCKPDLLREIRENANNLGVGIGIIIGQTPIEFREILKRYGKTPIEFINDLGFLGPDVILVHCPITSVHPRVAYPGGGNDLQIIAESGATVAETDLAYIRGGRWLHTHARYKLAGINIAIGTAVWPQDILEEIRAAVYSSKMIEGSTFATTAMDGYNAATLGGARAVGREDLGRIVKGAKADLVIFDLKTRRMAPIRDPIKNIIYSATSEDIETVFIGGIPVVQSRQVIQLNEKELAEKMQDIAKKFWEAVPHNDYAGRTVDEKSPLSLLVWEE